MTRQPTIEQKYRDIKGFTRGFDYLRFILAFGVVVQHGAWSVGGDAASQVLWAGRTRIIFGAILPMFFALSGFLVAGSIKRNPTIVGFMTLRALRLLPALIVEVTLSAVLLGPLLTTISLTSYFHNREFWLYFTNVFGWIHYQLPGVFCTVPAPCIVNKSLWTIPFELECYLALMFLYAVGVVRRRWLFALTAVVFMLVGTAEFLLHPNAAFQLTHPQGRTLVVAFLFGVAGNLYSDRIRLSPAIATFCAILSAILSLRYETSFLSTLPLAYLTIYLGMLNPPRVPILMSGDYSYGLYLFAFPIQQTVTLLVPGYRNWLFNVISSTLLGLLFASGSWWLVESKFLSKKRSVVAFIEGASKRLIAYPFSRAQAVGLTRYRNREL